MVVCPFCRLDTQPQNTPQGLLCPACLNTGRVPPGAPAAYAPQPAAPAKSSTTKIVVIVLALVIGIPILITIVLAATVFVLVSDIGSETNQDLVRDRLPSHAGFERVTIPEGDYVFREYCGGNSTQPIRVSVSAYIYQGHRMDVFVFDETDYANYQASRSFSYETGTRLNVFDYEQFLTFPNTGGCYYVVFDNTVKGQAVPPSDGVEDSILLEYRETES